MYFKLENFKYNTDQKMSACLKITEKGFLRVETNQNENVFL